MTLVGMASDVAARLPPATDSSEGAVDADTRASRVPVGVDELASAPDVVTTLRARIAQLEASIRQRDTLIAQLQQQRTVVPPPQNDNDKPEKVNTARRPTKDVVAPPTTVGASRVTALASCLGVVVIGLGVLSMFGGSPSSGE